MRSLPILLLLFVFTTGSAFAQSWGWGRETVRGNGDLITQDRDVQDFDGVKACCNFTVEITPGNKESVRVEAESNLQEYIETKVFGGTLEISFRDRTNVKPKEAIMIYVTMPMLKEVDASSSADIYTTGEFAGDRLKLESSSGSSVKVMYSGETVSADASSGGRIEVRGTTKYVEAEASSGGRVLGDRLTAEEADADVSSGGTVEVHATKKLKADASSGGTVRYNGNPTSVNTDASSGGSVRKG